MFQLCEAMKWNHLPIEGGLYDQDPRLLEEFTVIFNRRAMHEAQKREIEDQKAGRK